MLKIILKKDVKINGMDIYFDIKGEKQCNNRIILGRNMYFNLYFNIKKKK